METDMKLDRQNKIQLKEICSENSFSACRDNSNKAYDFESLVRDVCSDSNTSFADNLGNSCVENESTNLDPPLAPGSQSEVSQIIDGPDGDLVSQLNKHVGAGVPLTGEISIFDNYSDSANNENGSSSNQNIIGSQSDEIQISSRGAVPEAKHSVTILPSTSENGEVKYVIVVHPTVTKSEESCEANDTIPISESEQTLIRIKRKIRKIPAYPVQKCDLCDYTNPFKALINRHRKTHSEVRPFTCQICDKGFKDKRNYDFHKNVHSGTKPFTCRQCNKTFATIGEQGRHIRYMHTGEKPHKCDRCEFSSVELYKLKKHIRRHLGEDRFPCSKCPFTTSDSFKLEYHMSVVHLDDYYCEECDLNFTMAGALQDHKLDHLKGAPVFACALCPLTCAFKETLTEHMQVLHKFGSPRVCKDCGKSLLDRNSYKIHRRTHRGYKFKCKLCPYKATYKSQINVHMYLHTDSFSSYERKKRLSEYKPSTHQRHVSRLKNDTVKIPNTVLSTLAKQKKHECPTCEEEFKDFETLKKHFIVHLAKANRGVKMDTSKLINEHDKRENVVSLEDLDELSGFDVLKSPANVSLLPNVLQVGMSLDNVSPDGFSPDGVSPDGFSPDGGSPDGVSPESVFSDGALPISMSLHGVSVSVSILSDGISQDCVLPDGVFPDGVLPISISLDGVSPCLSPNAILLDGVSPDSGYPDGVFPNSVLPNADLLDAVSSDCVYSDDVFPDGGLPPGMSSYRMSPDGMSTDNIAVLHIESNSKLNFSEDIVDQFEKMQQEFIDSDNNNDEYAKDETVNIECDLISCMGLDELVENMDEDDDISLSSVF